MLRILILTCLLFEAVFVAAAAHISAYGNTTAAFGGDAHYRCVMDKPEGVQQVTWQRLFGDSSIENLATYSKRFGIQINSPYHGKVTLTEPSLSSTSITLKNVTWKDESCYICSFNVYPNGSTRKQTCITVQGISEVYTQSSTTIKGDEKKDRDVVFSCSATGKPAPTIEWDFSTTATKLSQTQTTTVKNSDHTFTSSCNITLKIPPRWTGHVDCVLNRGGLERGRRGSHCLWIWKTTTR
uniref:Ig-like domain-containing protein n=1 Tax=Anabas testudineus TaxID=64144 RepID=A0A7N6F953_ANATE